MEKKPFLDGLFVRFVSDDVVISFSKKRYRATVSVTSRPGTSIVTVQASTGNSQIAVHYAILSVNRKPYSGKTPLFGMDSVRGTVCTITFVKISYPIQLATGYREFLRLRQLSLGSKQNRQTNKQTNKQEKKQKEKKPTCFDLCTTYGTKQKVL